jgi:hypothetical protein
VLRRSVIALAAVALGLSAAGCGDKISNVTQGEDEGTFVDVGALSYQVQISRYLNPYDVEDKSYLAGLPAGTPVDQKGQLWFGVFVRIKNHSGQSQTPAPVNGYVITDTLNHQFRPLQLNRRVNEYAYTPQKMLPAAWLPNQQSTPGINPINGELLLYRLPISAIQNRPLDLHINQGSGSASISLDL